MDTSEVPTHATQAAIHNILSTRRKSHRIDFHHEKSRERLSLIEEIKLASGPAKTPVTILEEFLSRRGETPKYEFVQIEGTTHEPIYRYRAFVNTDFVAIGTGRSQEAAKQAAAKILLNVLRSLPQTTEENSGRLALGTIQEEMEWE